MEEYRIMEYLELAVANQMRAVDGKQNLFGVANNASSWLLLKNSWLISTFAQLRSMRYVCCHLDK